MMNTHSPFGTIAIALIAVAGTAIATWAGASSDASMARRGITPSLEGAARPTSLQGSDVYIIAKHIHTPSDDVTYPQLTGMKNVQAEARVNAWLKRTSGGMRIDSPQVNTTYQATYNLLTRRGSVVELMLTAYDYAQGAAHGMPGQVVAIINTDNGSIYKMTDFFRPNSPYLKRLSDEIRKQDKAHVLDSFQKFTGVTEKDGFYLTDNAVVVYFTPYEWTAYALGFVSYHIPYTHLMDIINTRSPLWAAFHSPAAVQQRRTEQANLRLIRALGFRVQEDMAAQSPDGQGGTLYAWDAFIGRGEQSYEKVFFFDGSRYLGTDTLKAHGYVMNVYPSNKATISVSYASNGKPFIISYHWSGTRLVPNRGFPAAYKLWQK